MQWNDRVLRYLERQNELLGGNNNDMSVDDFGNPVRVAPVSLFEGFFTYNLPASIWRKLETDDATAGSVDGELKLDAGTTDGAVSAVRSSITPKYQSNRAHRFSTASLTLPSSGALVRWGMWAEKYGYYFEWDADNSKLYACVRNTTGITPPSPEDHTESSPAGTTTITKEEIDTSTLGADFDPTINCLWDISFQWRGAGNIYFYINLKLVHVITRLQVGSALSTVVPSHPVKFEIENVGGATNPQACFGCADISTMGGVRDFELYTSRVFSATDTSVSNSEKAILAVRLGQYLYGIHNTRDLLLHGLSASMDDKTRIRMYLNPDSVTVSSWTMYSTIAGESIAEYAVPSAFTIGSGRKIIDRTSATNFETELPHVHMSADSEFGYQDLVLITAQKAVGGTTTVTTVLDVHEDV